MRPQRTSAAGTGEISGFCGQSDRGLRERFRAAAGFSRYRTVPADSFGRGLRDVEVATQRLSDDFARRHVIVLSARLNLRLQFRVKTDRNHIGRPRSHRSTPATTSKRVSVVAILGFGDQATDLALVDRSTLRRSVHFVSHHSSPSESPSISTWYFDLILIAWITISRSSSKRSTTISSRFPARSGASTSRRVGESSSPRSNSTNACASA